MPSRVGSTFLLSLLACSIPLCRAQDQAAPVYASPGATVNGAKPLAHEILPGDVIEIPANENLILHPSGDEVKVEPSSSAVYTNQKQIELRNGTSTVSTKSGVTVHVHHYTVTPTAPYSLPGFVDLEWWTRLGLRGPSSHRRMRKEADRSQRQDRGTGTRLQSGRLPETSRFRRSYRCARLSGAGALLLRMQFLAEQPVLTRKDWLSGRPLIFFPGAQAKFSPCDN